MKNQLLKHRRKLIIVFHAAVFIAAYWLSFGLRFDFEIPDSFLELFLFTLPFFVLAKILIFDQFRLYQGWWRYVGMKDLSMIIQASFASTLVVMAVGYLFFRPWGYPRTIPAFDWLCRTHDVMVYWRFPRTIPVVDFVLTIGLLGGARFGIRAIREGRLLSIPWRNIGTEDFRRVLIVGAGDAGEALVREISKRPELHYTIVGFLDDSPYKRNVRIHGHRVFGEIGMIKEICEQYEAQEILIAIPSATGKLMRRVIELCEGTGLPIKTIPGMDQLIDGRVAISQLREVQIEDLLGREPVELDRQAIGEYLNRKKVLVTGAAGSIGSEMCRQVLAYHPRELILVDQSETGLFDMGNELKSHESAQALRFFVGDINDLARMSAILKQTEPEVVFHAAAYKHVPIMEDNPGEAIKNNVGGTRNLAELCESFGSVRRFVLISTDKAVNPTSVMGATKRIAELCLQDLARGGRTRFIAVRFGNVLGSAGSVVPLFKEQIKKGGPVTVTHPDMIRYFMTIPEAAQLVLQAGAMGRGGEIFVLDMGEPVKILDLATSLIKLSGFRPDDDIKIEFTGVRPGEKLFEELSLDREDVARTAHPKVFVLNCPEEIPPDFKAAIHRLVASADVAPPADLKREISGLVHEYQCPEIISPRR